MSDAPDSVPAVEDFPAAHSMDTTWWAVDQHGHVAKFSTGEAGAAPATSQEAPDDSQLMEALAQSGTAFHCDDLFSEADGKLYERSWKTPWMEVAKHPAEPATDLPYANGYLLWLRDERALAELRPPSPAPSLLERAARLLRATSPAEPSNWTLLRLPVRDKVVVWLSGIDTRNPPPMALIRDLLDRGVIRRAWVYDRDLEFERFGVYAYELEHFDNWITGPFEKTGDPPHPLKADSLPESFRSAAELCPLGGVDFRREVLVQPFEHVESQCWAEDWLSTTGQRRPTTEFGPQAMALPSSAVEQLAAAVIPRGSTLVALIASYLKVESGSSEVLGDYLVEAGQARIEDRPTAAERLDEVLLRFFTGDERQSLEADFVEHLLDATQERPETARIVRSAIDVVRKHLAGVAAADQLQAAQVAAFEAWSPYGEAGDDEPPAEGLVEEPERSRLAWAAWALAKQMPLVAARTARALGVGELGWQVQRTLDALGQKRA